MEAKLEQWNGFACTRSHRTFEKVTNTCYLSSSQQGQTNKNRKGIESRSRIQKGKESTSSERTRQCVFLNKKKKNLSRFFPDQVETCSLPSQQFYWLFLFSSWRSGFGTTALLLSAKYVAGILTLRNKLRIFCLSGKEKHSSRCSSPEEFQAPNLRCSMATYHRWRSWCVVYILLPSTAVILWQLSFSGNGRTCKKSDECQKNRKKTDNWDFCPLIQSKIETKIHALARRCMPSIRSNCWRQKKWASERTFRLLPCEHFSCHSQMVSRFSATGTASMAKT